MNYLQEVNDVYYNILVKLDGISLVSQCKINKDALNTCKSQSFWLYFVNSIDHIKLQKLFTDLCYENHLDYLKLLKLVQ